MPLYEYKCTACDSVIEKLRKYSDCDSPVEDVCCEGATWEYQFSTQAFLDPVVMGVKRLDSGASELMRRIHKGAGTKMKTKFSHTA